MSRLFGLLHSLGAYRVIDPVGTASQTCHTNKGDGHGRGTYSIFHKQLGYKAFCGPLGPPIGQLVLLPLRLSLASYFSHQNLL